MSPPKSSRSWRICARWVWKSPPSGTSSTGRIPIPRWSRSCSITSPALLPAPLSDAGSARNGGALGGWSRARAGRSNEDSPVTSSDPSGLCGPICVTAQRILEVLGSAGQRARPWLEQLRAFRPFGFRLTSTVRQEILKAASRIDPGDKGGRLTFAGRALAKHDLGSGPGSPFPRATGGPDALNRQGQRIAESILRNATRTEVRHERWGDLITIWDQAGRATQIADPVKGPIRFTGFGG